MTLNKNCFYHLILLISPEKQKVQTSYTAALASYISTSNPPFNFHKLAN